MASNPILIVGGVLSAIASLLHLAVIAGGPAWYRFFGAGAGLIPRLPLIRTALVLISAVYLLRGLVLVPAFVLNPGGVTPFVLWSSLIVLVYGLAYAVGTWTAWSALSARAAG